jgi:hypothetical protein
MEFFQLALDVCRNNGLVLNDHNPIFYHAIPLFKRFW